MPSTIHPLTRWPLLAGALPGLRPIEDLLPPTFGERYGVPLLLCLLGALMVSAAAAWWFRRARPAVASSPAEAARSVLGQLVSEPDDGALAGSVLKTLRHYFPAVCPALPRGELTAGELATLLGRELAWAPELKAEATVLLRQCERRQFQSGRRPEAARLAARALDLIGKIEAARAASPAPAAIRP